MSPGQIWIGGKYSKLQAASPGDTFVFDLSASTIANLTPPYDFLRFCISVATLDELAYERGVRRVGGLRATRVGSYDPIMYGLALSILPVLREPARATTLFLDSIALAFHAHAIYAYGSISGSMGSVRSGLAPWQLRRANAFIEAHLDKDPSISDIAKECGLSASHFARAFRQACGMPPHRWLLKRRIERAKELLLDGDLEIAQIALACGFTDQSHLTRAFSRSEGYSPGKWRRLRRY
jgi:AraC-like DNA-binding protein